MNGRHRAWDGFEYWVGVAHQLTRGVPLPLQDSMKKGIYSSPSAVAYDLFLVWANAREYNEQGSQVYNDAEKLEVSPAVLPVLKTRLATDSRARPT